MKKPASQKNSMSVRNLTMSNTMYGGLGESESSQSLLKNFKQ